MLDRAEEERSARAEAEPADDYSYREGEDDDTYPPSCCNQKDDCCYPMCDCCEEQDNDR
jgi:hypothetical protein